MIKICSTTKPMCTPGATTRTMGIASGVRGMLHERPVCVSCRNAVHSQKTVIPGFRGMTVFFDQLSMNENVIEDFVLGDRYSIERKLCGAVHCQND